MTFTVQTPKPYHEHPTLFPNIFGSSNQQPAEHKVKDQILTSYKLCDWMASKKNASTFVPKDC